MSKCTPATSEAGTEECYHPRWLGLAVVLAGWAAWRVWQRTGWVAWRVWQRTCRRPALPPPASQPVEIPLTPSASADDLTRIEGIGPRVAALLEADGITTFAQLAVTEVTQLKNRLRAARLPFMDPTTWPQQAGLAAAGAWEGLAVLQEELKGGRRP